MPFVYNVPFICIFLSMVTGVVLSLVKSGRLALRVTQGVAGVTFVLSSWLASELYRAGTSFIFTMGKFPAPWGNELKCSVFEAGMAAALSFMLFIAIPGGERDFFRDIPQKKQHTYCLFILLTLASVLVMIYTNDLFTAYVFVEIMAIVSAALVMAEEKGRSIAAAMRYAYLTAVGSGLFLMGITITYYITGHLLMEDLGRAIGELYRTGEYRLQMTVGVGLMVLGLCIKSGLFPFHGWVPEAYSACTTLSSEIQSGLISKCYLFIIIKLFTRIFSIELLQELRVTNLLFALGVLGMIFCSISAMREKESRRMLAFSSVAQVAYIFMGLGLGTPIGIAAACYQMMAHTFTKPLLFICTGALRRCGEGGESWHDLRGTARKNLLAGVAFSVGGLSLCGLPLLAGFAAKFELATAAVEVPGKMLVTLVVLGVSSLLNSLYYIPAIITIWFPPEREEEEQEQRPAVREKKERDPAFAVSTVLFLACILCLGIFIGPTMNLIVQGVYGL